MKQHWRGTCLEAIELYSMAFEGLDSAGNFVHIALLPTGWMVDGKDGAVPRRAAFGDECGH